MSAAKAPALVSLYRRDHVIEITLNRGDKANALSGDLVDALSRAVSEALGVFEREGRDAATLVLRGSGKHFCAGFDLSTLTEETDESLIARLDRLEQLLQMVYHAPCATVALIHGSAFGAGFDLAMACDDRLAAADARFRMPGWRMGLALGTRRTGARVGYAAAFDFLRSAAVIGAERALANGFVTEIADPVIWSRRVDEISTNAGMLPAGGYARLKRLLLADTRDADRAELLKSLRETPLKPRMLHYLSQKI